MEYFEDLAELIETEDEVSFEDIYEALGEGTSEDTGEIIENYMEEILKSIPDEDQELYLLIENIKTGMLFLCENLEEDSTKSELAEEIEKFRKWYTIDMNTLVDGQLTTVIDAIATERANKITGDISKYYFTGALNYELKDFNFSIGKFDKIDILEDSEDDSSN